ncbi:hypothetical protein FC35_GL000875 [Limosilactobacillus coleohominis DSM 14060]|nr:hypothetical protein FC35_GL000875 [Limosilactobacillus coleohominis DSM 14060]
MFFHKGEQDNSMTKVENVYSIGTTEGTLGGLFVIRLGKLFVKNVGKVVTLVPSLRDASMFITVDTAREIAEQTGGRIMMLELKDLCTDTIHLGED